MKKINISYDALSKICNRTFRTSCVGRKRAENLIVYVPQLQVCAYKL